MAADEVELVKGWVRLWTFPSLPDLADAYEKSEESSFTTVVCELIKRQNDCGIKRLMTPKNAVVEIQTLPDFKTIAKTIVDEKGGYSIRMNEGNVNRRVYCKVELDEFGKKACFIGSSRVWWNQRQKAYAQDIDLSRDNVSVAGRCVDKNGSAVGNAHVEVTLIMTPTHGEDPSSPLQLAKTDNEGRWRVDGVAAPSFERLIAYVADTNRLNCCDEKTPPLKIKVEARRRYIPMVNEVTTTVPNVTAAKRSAIEKIIKTWERKNAKKYPMPHPLEEFPVSTNDVIYIPDMILP